METCQKQTTDPTAGIAASSWEFFSHQLPVDVQDIMPQTM